MSLILKREIMKNVLKSIVVVAVVVFGFSNYVVAASHQTIARDTVIPDTTKQEVMLSLVTRADVVWTKIDVADVPQAVKDAVAKKYEGYTIEEAYKGDNDQYKLILKKDEQTITVIYDKDGKFISEGEK
ncbi:hypothetical protein DMB45_03000 [Sanguibacteroides justesenii]|nr:hypothetical protein DMB45_03000 [Sanguibacteroides justesenii]